MKLRILNNSLRLRLSQHEIREFVKENSVSSIMELPMSQRAFMYSLSTHERDSCEVIFLDHHLRIALSKIEVLNWANSEQISIQHMLPVGKTRELKVLVEKDFQCLKPREGEDQSDLFPNPNALENATNSG